MASDVINIIPDDTNATAPSVDSESITILPESGAEKKPEEKVAAPTSTKDFLSSLKDNASLSPADMIAIVEDVSGEPYKGPTPLEPGSAPWAGAGRGHEAAAGAISAGPEGGSPSPSEKSPQEANYGAAGEALPQVSLTPGSAEGQLTGEQIRKLDAIITPDPIAAFAESAFSGFKSVIGQTEVGAGRMFGLESFQKAGQELVQSASKTPRPADYFDSGDYLNAGASLIGNVVGGLTGLAATIVPFAIGSEAAAAIAPIALTTRLAPAARLLMQSRFAKVLGDYGHIAAPIYLQNLGAITTEGNPKPQDYATASLMTVVDLLPFPSLTRRLKASSPQAIAAGEATIDDVRREVKQKIITSIAKTGSLMGAANVVSDLILGTGEALKGNEDWFKENQKRLVEDFVVGFFAGGALGGGVHAATGKRIKTIADLRDAYDRDPVSFWVKGVYDGEELLRSMAISGLVPSEFSAGLSKARKYTEAVTEAGASDYLEPIKRMLLEWSQEPEKFHEKYPEASKVLASGLKNSIVEFLLPQHVRSFLNKLEDSELGKPLEEYRKEYLDRIQQAHPLYAKLDAAPFDTLADVIEEAHSKGRAYQAEVVRQTNGHHKIVFSFETPFDVPEALLHTRWSIEPETGRLVLDNNGEPLPATSFTAGQIEQDPKTKKIYLKSLGDYGIFGVKADAYTPVKKEGDRYISVANYASGRYIDERGYGYSPTAKNLAGELGVTNIYPVDKASFRGAYSGHTGYVVIRNSTLATYAHELGHSFDNMVNAMAPEVRANLHIEWHKRQIADNIKGSTKPDWDGSFDEYIAESVSTAVHRTVAEELGLDPKAAYMVFPAKLFDSEGVRLVIYPMARRLRNEAGYDALAALFGRLNEKVSEGPIEDSYVAIIESLDDLRLENAISDASYTKAKEIVNEFFGVDDSNPTPRYYAKLQLYIGGAVEESPHPLTKAVIRYNTKTLRKVFANALLSDTEEFRKTFVKGVREARALGWTRRSADGLLDYLFDTYGAVIPRSALPLLAKDFPVLKPLTKSSIVKRRKTISLGEISAYLHRLTAVPVFDSGVIRLNGGILGQYIEYPDKFEVFLHHADFRPLIETHPALDGKTIEFHTPEGTITTIGKAEGPVKDKALQMVVRQHPLAHAELLKFNNFMKWATDVHQLARLNPKVDVLQRLDNATRSWERTKGQIFSDSLDALDTLRKLSKKEAEKVFTVMEHQDSAGTFFNVYRNEEDGTYTYRYEVETQNAGTMVLAEYTLNESEHLAVQRTQKMFQNIIKEVYDALIASSRRKGDEANAQRLQLERDKLMQTPYIPMSRFGDYALITRPRLGAEYTFQLFPTKRARNAAAKQAAKEGLEVITDVKNLSDHPYLLLPEATLNRILDDPEVREHISPDLREKFQRLIVRHSSERSARRHLLHRRRIQGYSRDIAKVAASYVFSMSHLIARLRHIDEFASIASEIRDTRHKREIYTAAGTITDSSKLSQLSDFVDRHIETLVAPKEELPVFRVLVTLYYLGLNAVHWALNLTQVPMSLGVLSARLGEKYAARGMALAISRSKKYKADLSTAMQRAVEDNLIDESLVLQVAGLANSDAYHRSIGTGMESLLFKASTALMYPFHFTEVLARRLGFSASYIAARERGFTHEDAYLFAKGVIEDSQFDYSRAYRPLFMRGRLAPITIFFTWMQKMLHLLGGAYGEKEALYSLFVFGGMAGAFGMPFAEDVMNLLDALYEAATGRYSNIRRAALEHLGELFGQDAATLVAYGASAKGFGFLPFDLSNNIGMARLVPGLQEATRTSPLATPAEKALTTVASVGGAGVSALLNLFYVVPGFGDPDAWYNRYRALPKFARNIWDAYSIYEEGGYRLRNEDLIVLQPKSWSDRIVAAISAGLGGKTHAMLTRLEDYYDRKGWDMFWQLRKQALRDQIKHAYVHGDFERIKKLKKEITYHNRYAPFFAFVKVSPRDIREWTKNIVTREENLGLARGSHGKAIPSYLRPRNEQ